MSRHPFVPTVPEHWELVDAKGSVPFLHPTHVRFVDPKLDANVEWRAARHRKVKPVKVSPRQGGRVRRRFPRIWGGNRWSDWTNISWWEAQGFLLGSICWCVNGTFAFRPLNDSEGRGQVYTIGYTALVGGTLFQLGGLSAFWEALNRPSHGAVNFGYDVHELETKEPTVFHQVQLPVQPGSGHYATLAKDGDQVPVHPAHSKIWRWWGLKLHDIGFLANASLLVGTTIFWVSTITGVPGALPAIGPGHYWEWDILYWLPQCIGSCMFILQGILCMLEVQTAWWAIRPLELGWHVGLFNLIGGVGFWLSGFYGFYLFPADKWQHYGTAFSTFWGSWAFLIASYLQLWETLN